jgi:hypothetical protein
LKKVFKDFKTYVSNPPEEQTIGWVFHHMEKGEYEEILKKFGGRYLLIVLYLLEENEEYEECKILYDTIVEYNKKYKLNYSTHIRNIKNIY